MMLLPYLITLIAFMGLVRSSPIVAIEKKDTELAKRNRVDCYTKGAVYRHGQVIPLKNSRCIKYRCMSGSIRLYDEGCDAFKQCWPVNNQFRHNCQDFKCGIDRRGGRKQYVVKPIGQQMCRDVYGQCMIPGEIFSHNLNGTVRSNCYCSIDEGKIRYQCFNAQLMEMHRQGGKK